MPPDARSLLSRSPVIPVLTIHDLGVAVPLASALAAGGLTILEVTLRTPAALQAIEAIATALPKVTVGAGTVLAAADIPRAMAAGAEFLVTPGTTADMAAALTACPIPCLPGCATVSEALALAARGFKALKFFPAEASGGVGWLKGVGAPLPDLLFCPTGGIDAAKAPAYLACKNVGAVGGSWVAPDEAIRAGDWSRIEALARAARALRA